MANQPVGSFVSAKLVELKSEVAQTHNAGGYVSIYARVARLVKDEYPDLTDQQTAMVYRIFERDAELTKESTHQDVHGGLGSAGRILGLRSPDAKPGEYQVDLGKAM